MTSKLRKPRIQHHVAGQLYEVLVSQEIKDKLQDLVCVGHPEGIHSFRNLYEDYDGKDSCLIVRGPIIVGETQCYLSGLLIDPSDSGLKAEGEHLLPVYKALAYLSLIYKSDGLKKIGSDGIRDPNVTNEQILEFDWACRVANQEKSDTDYTKVVDEQFRTNEDAIKADLHKMWNSTRTDAVKFKKKLKKKYKTENAFISERLPYLKGRFDEICTYINGKIEQRDAELMKLAGFARIVDAPIPEQAWKLIQQSSYPHLYPEKSHKERLKELEKQKRDAEAEAMAALIMLSCKPSYNSSLKDSEDKAADALLYLSRGRHITNRNRSRSPRRYQNNNRIRNGGKLQTRKNVKTKHF